MRLVGVGQPSHSILAAVPSQERKSVLLFLACNLLGTWDIGGCWHSWILALQ
ncbi:hypothetical protein LINPERHAP2_LOCUS41271 [Linum perenne]